MAAESERVMKLQSPWTKYRRIILLPSLCLSLLTVTACEMNDNVRETKDTSTEILNTSRSIHQGTLTVQQISARLERVACDTKDDIEQSSIQLRKEAIKAMDAAEMYEDKLAYAGSFVRAFEFQLWNDACGIEKEELYESDLDFFFRFARSRLQKPENLKREIGELAQAIDDLEPADLLEKRPALQKQIERKEHELQNARANIMALATVIHRKNRKQEPSRNETEPKGISDLIMDAVALEKTVAKEDRPAWTKKVLQNKELLAPLMKIRANAMLALNISRLVPFGRGDEVMEKILSEEGMLKPIPGVANAYAPSEELLRILGHEDTNAMVSFTVASVDVQLPGWSPRFATMSEDEADYILREIALGGMQALVRFLPELGVLPTEALNPNLAVAYRFMLLRDDILAKDPDKRSFTEHAEVAFYQTLAKARLVELQ